MRESGKQFIDATLELWGRRTARMLSREDAREIVRNMSGFFQVLIEWESKTHENSGAFTQVISATEATALRSRSR